MKEGACVEFSEFPLSPRAGSYCFYLIVSEELVWSLYILVFLVYFLFPFPFDSEPKIHMINILQECIRSLTVWEKQTLDFKKAPKGLEFVV